MEEEEPDFIFPIIFLKIIFREWNGMGVGVTIKNQIITNHHGKLIFDNLILFNANVTLTNLYSSQIVG